MVGWSETFGKEGKLYWKPRSTVDWLTVALEEEEKEEENKNKKRKIKQEEEGKKSPMNFQVFQDVTPFLLVNTWTFRIIVLLKPIYTDDGDITTRQNVS